MKKILVVGADGLIGQNLCKLAVEKGIDAVGTYKKTSWARYCPMGIMDPINAEEVKEVMKRYQPDVVFIDSSCDSPEYCETHPQEGWAANVEGVLNIVTAAKEVKSRTFLISTDLVYNGDKDTKYVETDPPEPLSKYAQMKLEGERIVLDASKQNCVCRVSATYGINKATPKYNFITWALDQMKSNRAVKLLKDQYVTPSYAPDCAAEMMLMAERMCVGIYHLAVPECLSRYEMGLKMAEVFGFDPALCVGINSNEVEPVVIRGKNTCLDTTKVVKEIGRPFMSFEDTLRELKKNDVDRKKESSIETGKSNNFIKIT
ncbi:SDR family oxidoreductase [Candidatus Methanomassiliicoccus intestinalis]|uniref:SDR family oxidoreductase n=1 Tax=Candidatus Methanomassiliicoccus intestinalis TaxID=1406512 RepID=UPI0037DD7406